MTVIEKIKSDLEYRLPNSGKPLAYIVLDRSQALQLMEEVEPVTVEGGLKTLLLDIDIHITADVGRTRDDHAAWIAAAVPLLRMSSQAIRAVARTLRDVVRERDDLVRHDGEKCSMSTSN